MQHTDVPAWNPMLHLAAIGAVIILIGVCFQITQLVVSIRTRARRRDLTGDPWNGRTLEWSTTSPPPSYNYAVLPVVHGTDAFWTMKTNPQDQPRVWQYKDIEMPRNSPVGFISAFFAVVLGFALIWHIWWMALCGLAGALGIALVHAWRVHGEIEISAETLAQTAGVRVMTREDA